MADEREPVYVPVAEEQGGVQYMRSVTPSQEGGWTIRVVFQKDGRELGVHEQVDHELDRAGALRLSAAAAEAWIAAWNAKNR